MLVSRSKRLLSSYVQTQTEDPSRLEIVNPHLTYKVNLNIYNGIH
jgi:hypothetical protein